MKNLRGFSLIELIVIMSVIAVVVSYGARIVVRNFSDDSDLLAETSHYLYKKICSITKNI